LAWQLRQSAYQAQWRVQFSGMLALYDEQFPGQVEIIKAGLMGIDSYLVLSG